MNTQLIHDIMLDYGWNLPTGVDKPTSDTVWWRVAGGEFQTTKTLPDTLDAAVGVIEGAGWSLDDILTGPTKDKGHSCFALAVKHDGGTVSAIVYYEDTAANQRRALREVLWQLALACVKSQRKEPQ